MGNFKCIFVGFLYGVYMGDIIVKIDGRGRVLIPSSIRKLLNLEIGSKLRLKLVGGCIVLEPVVPECFKVVAGRKWGEEAFLDAGEATFGE